MSWRGLAASVLTVILSVSGCATMSHSWPERPGRCSRAMPCTVVTTELSPERRTELLRLVEDGITHRTLIAVAYDGQHLRLQPECRIEGEYDWRDMGLERHFDSDSALFVAEEPYGIDGFVRIAEPRRTEFRATRWAARGPRLVHRPQALECGGVTHVIDGVIVGVAPDADPDAKGLPAVLQLDRVRIGDPPPPPPEDAIVDDEPQPKPKPDPLVIASTIIVVVGLAIALPVTFADPSEF
jgi:hypothetical protein